MFLRTCSESSRQKQQKKFYATRGYRGEHLINQDEPTIFQPKYQNLIINKNLIKIFDSLLFY